MSLGRSSYQKSSRDTHPGFGATIGTLGKILATELDGEPPPGQLLAEWWKVCSQVPITGPMSAFLLARVMERQAERKVETKLEGSRE